MTHDYDPSVRYADTSPREAWGGMKISLEATVHLGSVQRFVDGLKDDIDLREDVVVPEAQNSKASRSEKVIPSSVVVRLLDVLASIELDNHPSIHAGEVADVGPHRMLPTELETRQLTSS